MEYIHNSIYANVWRTEFIVEIDPENGSVLSLIDLSGILKPEDYSHTIDVLNGIAYNNNNNNLLVTGKFWPKIFEIELIPLE